MLRWLRTHGKQCKWFCVYLWSAVIFHRFLLSTDKTSLPKSLLKSYRRRRLVSQDHRSENWIVRIRSASRSPEMFRKKSTNDSRACKFTIIHKFTRSLHWLNSIFVNRQKLMDGATPIVVIDTDDIIQSLQRASLKNKEAAKDEDSPSQEAINSNGSV